MPTTWMQFSLTWTLPNLLEHQQSSHAGTSKAVLSVLLQECSQDRHVVPPLELPYSTRRLPEWLGAPAEARLLDGGEGVERRGGPQYVLAGTHHDIGERMPQLHNWAFNFSVRSPESTPSFLTCATYPFPGVQKKKRSRKSPSALNLVINEERLVPPTGCATRYPFN
jgi:hypothetical protein